MKTQLQRKWKQKPSKAPKGDPPKSSQAVRPQPLLVTETLEADVLGGKKRGGQAPEAMRTIKSWIHPKPDSHVRARFFEHLWALDSVTPSN